MGQIEVFGNVKYQRDDFKIVFFLVHSYFLKDPPKMIIAQSDGAVEYTDYTSAEG